MKVLIGECGRHRNKDLDRFGPITAYWFQDGSIRIIKKGDLIPSSSQIQSVPMTKEYFLNETVTKYLSTLPINVHFLRCEFKVVFFK